MKKSLFIVLCLLVLVSSLALAEEKPATQLEAFLSKKGNLIVKDSYNLGELPCNYGAKLTLDALVIYSPGQEGQKTKGLRIEITDGSKYSKSHTSFLDMEEIESLSNAITYMTKLMNDWSSVNKEYTEVIFSTKGDYQIGFFQGGTKQTVFSSSGQVGQVTCFLNATSDLSVVKKMVDKGIEILKEK